MQVCSVQTASRHLQKLGAYDFIIIDEAHHSRADQWDRVIAAQSGARLLGVTATPQRLDGRGLGVSAGGEFDDLVLGPPAIELIAAGYLSQVRCFSPTHRLDLDRLRVRMGDYVATDVAALVDNSTITGNAVEDYRARAHHQPAIAFCALVSHAEHVAEAFRDAGYRSACVHGKTDKDERDRLIPALGTGEIEVLTSCDLISEGLDVPAVGAVMRATKSLILHRQQIGRGMWPAPGKAALIVNDHVGNCIRHGIPEIEPVWSLDGVAKRNTPSLWECPECHNLNPLAASECGHCGYERPGADSRGGRHARGVIPGTLDELTHARLAAIGRLSYAQVLTRNMTERELSAFGQVRGYAEGWVQCRLWEQERLSPAERLRRYQSWVDKQDRAAEAAVIGEGTP